MRAMIDLSYSDAAVKMGHTKIQVDRQAESGQQLCDEVVVSSRHSELLIQQTQHSIHSVSGYSASTNCIETETSENRNGSRYRHCNPCGVT